MNAASRGRTPTTVKRTVRRGRRPNKHYRVREYLTEREVERLIKAAGRRALSSIIRWLGRTVGLPEGLPAQRAEPACDPLYDHFEE
jgi:hypothetical protein